MLKKARVESAAPVSARAFSSTEELRWAAYCYLTRAARPDRYEAGRVVFGELTFWRVGALTDFGGVFSVAHLRKIAEANGEAPGDIGRLETESLAGWDMSRAESLSYMFYGQARFEGAGLEHWALAGLRQVRDVEGLFSGCACLEGRVLSGWGVPLSHALERARHVFNGCAALDSRHLFDWGRAIGRCRDLRFLFNGCTSLTGAGLQYWAPFLGGVVSVRGVFRGCAALRVCFVAGWGAHLESVRDASFLFSRCVSLETADWSGWKPFARSVENLSYCFSGCVNLLSTGFDHWGGPSGELARVTSMTHMFDGCWKFIGVELRTWCGEAAGLGKSYVDMRSVFLNCFVLEFNIFKHWFPHMHTGTYRSITSHTEDPRLERVRMLDDLSSESAVAGVPVH